MVKNSRSVIGMYYADLHLHSAWSLATSADMHIEQIAVAACKKGITLLGTGDCTHPSWLKELYEKLEATDEGMLVLRQDVEASVFTMLPAACRKSTRFILQTEVSTIFEDQGRTRKIHHLVYLPDFHAAEKLSALLAPFGSLASDGRPTLRLQAKELLELVLEAHPSAFLIPAHIWTPWFSVLGSKTCYQSIEECYGELSPHIFAVETGLSSDPAMNRKVACLDRFQLVSCSDAHSPSKIGRKASKFSCACTFSGIRHALATGEGFEGTLELFPEEGKYFLDGHRKCGFSCTPQETRALQGLCPVCHKRLTTGVLHRVELLADGMDRSSCLFMKPFSYAIPLIDIVAQLFSVRPTSKKVQQRYEQLIASLGPELNILTEFALDQLPDELQGVLAQVRRGEVKKHPGFDGQYGHIMFS